MVFTMPHAYISLIVSALALCLPSLKALMSHRCSSGKREKVSERDGFLSHTNDPKTKNDTSLLRHFWANEQTKFLLQNYALKCFLRAVGER